MAGHSQFKNIMRRKGAQDAKRAKVFTKIAREIIVAAKSGQPDINFNAKLRSVVIKARQAGLPKDRIEAAIAKGAGTAGSEDYVAVRYEGYGPGGVAILIDALTDNRNRTAPEIRNIFTKADCTMGAEGSVAFMFDHIGQIEYSTASISEEQMLDAAIEAGADNCETADGTHTITTSMESFGPVRDALAAKFGDAQSAKLTFVPKSTSPVAGADAEKLMEFIETLEDNDDVQDVYSNAEFDAATLEKLSA